MKKPVNTCLLICFILFPFLNACDRTAEPEPEKPVELPLEKEGYTVLLNEEFEQATGSGLHLPTTHWLIYKNGWSPG